MPAPAPVASSLEFNELLTPLSARLLAAAPEGITSDVVEVLDDFRAFPRPRDPGASAPSRCCAPPPTALGTEKFGIGPTAVGLTQPGKWTIGILANQIWSTSGASDRKDVNTTYLQPFVNYNLGSGRSVGVSAEPTGNREADEDTWSAPLLFNVCKLAMLGNRPVNFTMAAGPTFDLEADGAGSGSFQDEAPAGIGWALTAHRSGRGLIRRFQMRTPLLRFSPRTSGARAHAVLLASVFALSSTPALAQAPAERLSDKGMKLLIDQVDEGRDKFEGNLDGAFKASTVRGPNGETKVSAALQDYQDSTKKLQSRFSPDYAAGPEAATVLRQSTAIDTFMKGQPSTMKGRREWERQVENLKLLAAAYGTTLPLPDGAAVRRMNDKEPLAAAASIAAAADRLKSAFDKDKSLQKPDKDAAKNDAAVVAKQAKTVRDRIRDGKPATGDVRLLLEHAARVETFVGAHENAAARTQWQGLQASLGKLEEAFGMTK